MYNYPLSMSFKILALNPQVKITDASGQTVLYVKEKALSLKMNTRIFADEAQTQQLYQITADKMMGFTIPFSITSPDGALLAKVVRQGAKSLWKLHFPIQDTAGAEIGLIHEENPWIKVLDALVSDIPFVGMWINPAYLIDLRGKPALYLKKQPSMLEGKFILEKRGDFTDADEKMLIPGVIMMLMMERMRG
jgi:uncharacterized protein YxjI